jgi:hypothetical protein
MFVSNGLWELIQKEVPVFSVSSSELRALSNLIQNLHSNVPFLSFLVFDLPLAVWDETKANG